METIKMKIDNIHCLHCLETIKMELEEIPGVSEVIGDIVTKVIEVTYQSPATVAEIKRKLIEINYPGIGL